MVAVTAAYPDVGTGRIYIDVTGRTKDHYVAVYRYQNGVAPVLLRPVYRRRRNPNGTFYYEEANLWPPPYDHEAPLDVELGYAAVEWKAPNVIPRPPALPQIKATLVAPGNGAWLTDPATPTYSMYISCLTMLPARTYKVNAGIFYPIDRRDAVTVHTRRNSWTGTLEWVSSTHREDLRFVRLFDSGGVLLFRTGSLYGSYHDYVQPADVMSSPMEVQRLPHRKWSSDLTVTIAPVGNRLLEEGGTYEDLAADYADYEDVLGKFINYYSVFRYEEDR